jgi:hypothetical protein
VGGEDKNKSPGQASLQGKDGSKDEDSASAKARKKGWFGKERRPSNGSSDKKSSFSNRSDRDGPEEDHLDKWKSREQDDSSRNVYGLGEDAVMGLS